MIFDIDRNIVKCSLAFSIEFETERNLDTVSKLIDTRIYTLVSQKRTMILTSVTMTYFDFLYNFKHVVDILESNKVKAKKLTPVFYIEPSDYSVSTFNITKFVLNYDEEYVLGKISDKDIKTFKTLKTPQSLSNAQNGFEHQCTQLFTDDNDLCIDFTESNRITVKYFTPADMKTTDRIFNVINFIINTIVNILRVSELSQSDLDKLNTISSENFESVLHIYAGYQTFVDHVESVELSIDLKQEPSLCDLYFNDFKDLLYELLYKIDFGTCQINYDTDSHRLQIKGIKKSDISITSTVDIVDCSIKKSKISNCDIYDCEFEHVMFIKCNFFNYCNVKKCKLVDCFVSRNVECEECSVTGVAGRFGGNLLSGEIYDTSIISGSIIENDVKKDDVLEC